MKEFSSLLTKSIDVSGKFTHVAMGECKGSWYLDDSKKEGFFDKYQELYKQTHYHIAEVPLNFTPLIFDIDLSETYDSPENIPDKLYKMEEVYSLLEKIRSHIKLKVKKENGFLRKKNLYSVLLEKPPLVKKVDDEMIVKNGYHLHFPLLYLSLEDAKDFFNTLTTNYGRKMDNVFGKPWLMYGSTKSDQKSYYKVTKTFKESGEEIDPWDLFKKIPCYKELNQETYVYYLPYLLSIQNLDSENLFQIEKTIYLPDVVPKLKSRHVKRTESSNEIVQKMKIFTELLSKDRSDNYHSWWSVGMTLYNIGTEYECLEEAKECWILFSQKSTKYDEDGLELAWSRMSNLITSTPRTMGSLIFMAKEDNPQKVQEFFENLHHTSDYIPTTDTEIADLCYSQNQDSFIYGNCGWFYFNGVIWQEVENPSRTFHPLFVKISKWLKSKVTEDMDPKISRMIQSSSKKCENYASQNNLLKTLEKIMGTDRLAQKLNMDKWLIAFKNGVYCLRTFMFREGSPQDYISKQLNIKYNFNFSIEHPAVLNMLEFLKKTFPDEEVREYFFLQTSEVFLGGNRDKNVMIWTGSGNNGKSILQELFEKMLGSLAVKLPKGILVGETPKAGCCFPELVRTQGGVRWAVIDEFSPDETVNAGMLKLLSGGDTLYARDLFQKGKDVDEFEPYFKLVLICNTIPGIRRPDRATWDRIKVIPFETTFKDTLTIEDANNKYIHLKDKQIKEKLSLYAEALAWYLLHIFKKKQALISDSVNGYDIKVPSKVSQATERYKEQSDVISQYISCNFDRTECKDDKIIVSNLYGDFKIWFVDCFPKRMVMEKRTFINAFLEHFNMLDSEDAVYNIKPKTFYDEDIEGFK